MADFRQVYSLENDVFKAYALYATILALKMFGMSVATVFRRFSKVPKVFSSPEDAYFFKGKVLIDADVERVRRAHQNDLENIVPFWILGLIFVATNPALLKAKLCFRIFTASRIAHSFAYILAIPQPVRALLFTVGLAVNVFLGCEILMHLLL